IRIGHLADSNLQTRQLGDSCMQVCAAPAYLERRGIPRTVNDLTHHNCLSYVMSSTQGRKYWVLGEKGDIRVQVSGDLLAANGAALVTADIGGQAIIYQPHFILDEALRRGDLVELTLYKPALKLGGISVLYPANRRTRAK